MNEALKAETQSRVYAANLVSKLLLSQPVIFARHL